MKKLRAKPQEFSGEVTAFLSLIFLLLLSIVGAMIQSASIYITKSMKRADMELAIESVFAEYHQELLKQYEIFAIEESNEIAISRRLQFYGAGNLEHEIEKIELLSDNCGAAFYEQAIRFMGIETVEGELPVDTEMEEEAQSSWNNLETLLQEEEKSLAGEENPIEIVNQLQKLSLLSLILSEPEMVSDRTIAEEELSSKRELQKGVGFKENFPQGDISHKLLFTTYLNQHFEHYLKDSKEHPLFYETEYLLAGKTSDRENLKAVANKLLAVRIGINYTYLFTSQERQAEAQAMALGLSSLLIAPEASEIVKQALLFAWAYGESILDLRNLFAGKKVPIIKTNENWNLQLANIPKLLKNEEFEMAPPVEEGATYQEYLKILLLTEKEEVLCMRALDLLEVNLGIRVDECVTGLQIKSTCRMQHNITDVFSTQFVYQ